MIPDPADTIVALASAPGPGARAIVRLSGPAVWRIISGCVPDLPVEPGFQRFLHAATLLLPGQTSALPIDVYFWPRPASYTGQDVAELHTLSSPPLVELLVAELLKAGARAAQPGEFTLRAFLAGKRDLSRAEAVLGVIHARDRGELRNSLAQLAGGLAQPLSELREDLLNLLADVEAGLDFSEEDLSFVACEELLLRLTRGLALVTLIGKQIDQRSTSGRPFRAVLAGPANAGKSSLFNALRGLTPLGSPAAALVSDVPGTTRDFLCATIRCEDVPVELVDTAGLVGDAASVAGTTGDAGSVAYELGLEQARQADLVLWCEPVDQARGEPHVPELACTVMLLATKSDLLPSFFPPSSLVTSAATGMGLDDLKKELAARARAHVHVGLAPSLSRCRHHVDACLEHLRHAHGLVLEQEPPELLAMELRIALDELGAMVGTMYTDDLLDRIFSRFCIGK